MSLTFHWVLARPISVHFNVSASTDKEDEYHGHDEQNDEDGREYEYDDSIGEN